MTTTPDMPMTIIIYAENTPGWFMHGVYGMLLVCEGGVFFCMRGVCCLRMRSVFRVMPKPLRGGFYRGFVLMRYRAASYAAVLEFLDIPLHLFHGLIILSFWV